MRILDTIGRTAKSYLTGPDGESYAPGRLMGFGVFAVGQGIVAYATWKIGHAVPPSDVAAWSTLMMSVATFEVAICTTAIGLVLGMAPTDSGGKWWSKDASPPPPPTPTTPEEQPK